MASHRHRGDEIGASAYPPVPGGSSLLGLAAPQPAGRDQDPPVPPSGLTYTDEFGVVQYAEVVSRAQALESLRVASAPKPEQQQQQQPERVSLFIEADGRSGLTPAHSGGAPAAQQQATAAAGRHYGEQLQALLVPQAGPASRWPAAWTYLFSTAAVFLFAYMAGSYRAYQLSPTFRAYNGGSVAQVLSTLVPLEEAWGPRSMLGWLRFWAADPAHSFDQGYLLAWGARYLPAIGAGDWWRLFSSVAIHANFSHLFSNILCLVVLAGPLEHTYNPLRTLIIFLASAFGGTFLSIVFEPPCNIYCGASGAVFGFLGLALADVILNWESIFKPAIRLALILLALGLTLGLEFATAASRPLMRVSHMSHIGGLAAGLVVSLMFLPNHADKRWKRARKLAARIGQRLSGGGGGAQQAARHAAATHEVAELQSCWRRQRWAYWAMWLASCCVMLGFFVVLPCWIWLHQLPHLDCPPLQRSD